jgi:hypothetical protein
MAATGSPSAAETSHANATAPNARDREGVERHAVRPVGVGEELAHVEKWRPHVGRRIGVDDDDGTAGIRRRREIERLQRMRARCSVARGVGVDRRALFPQRPGQRADVVEDDIERGVGEPEHAQHRLD